MDTRNAEIETLIPDPRRTEGTIQPVEIGFIGLATDAVGGEDLAEHLGRGIRLQPTRVAVDAELTPETLADMGPRLEHAAGLLLPARSLSAIVYSCTSGTIAIGREAVTEAITKGRLAAAPRSREALSPAPVIEPVGAVLAALAVRGARRISMVMPYRVDTAAMVAAHFEGAGLVLDRVVTLGCPGDREINALTRAQLSQAAHEARHPASEAVFICCTGLATAGLAAPLSRALALPVVTSNGALAHAVRRRLAV
ncbi:MAG: hypothetical protein AAF577_11490 [Pseudomonadota bacterium]